MLLTLSLNPRPLSSARVHLSVGRPPPLSVPSRWTAPLPKLPLPFFFVFLTYFGVLQEEMAVWMYLDR